MTKATFNQHINSVERVLKENIKENNELKLLNKESYLICEALDDENKACTFVIRLLDTVRDIVNELNDD